MPQYNDWNPVESYRLVIMRIINIQGLLFVTTRRITCSNKREQAIDMIRMRVRNKNTFHAKDIVSHEKGHTFTTIKKSARRRMPKPRGIHRSGITSEVMFHSRLNILTLP